MCPVPSTYTCRSKEVFSNHSGSNSWNNYNETNTFQNGIERGKKNFGGNENQQYDIWGGNKEILIIMGDKENAVENFEKEYLGFRR